MVIAPIRWSGEAFVNFAAKNPHTCLTVRSVHVWVLKSSQGQSLHQDFCFVSVENGISSCRLRFTISLSLISRPLA